MYYDSEALYILSKKDAAAKIVAIDNCIDVLLATVLLSVGKANKAEYMLDDGQTTIKMVYRNPNDVIASVALLRILRGQYMYDINGGAVRMLDGKNLILGRRYR